MINHFLAMLSHPDGRGRATPIFRQKLKFVFDQFNFRIVFSDVGLVGSP